MSDWAARPQVEASLLNPSLIALTVAHASSGYRESTDRSIPWPLAFLIPPLVLHRPTRVLLPRDTRTHFATWISRNPLLVAGFPRRAQAMIGLTREGIRLGLRTRQLAVNGGALISTSLAEAPAGELRQLLQASRLVGRWLGKLDQPSTALALLGVTP